MKTHRVGIVGCGRMASAMATAMAASPNLRVAGVVSDTGDVTRAQAFSAAFGVPEASVDLAHLVARPDLDLIYIANRTGRHAATAIAALDAGKNVLCEKPFAVSAAEGLAVADAARRSGRLFMEALWTPFLPAYVRAEAIRRTQVADGPHHLVASFGYPTTPLAHPGLYERSGGGVLLDRAVYPVSLALKMLGPVRDVQARIVLVDGIDVHASLQLLHDDGSHSQLAVSLQTLLSNEAVMSWPRGSLTWRAPLVGCEDLTLRSAAMPADAKAAPSAGPTLRDRVRSHPLARRLRRALRDGTREHHPFGTNQYLPMLAHVDALLAAAKSESDVVPLSHSLDVLRIIDAARAAQDPASRPVSRDAAAP